MLLIRGKTSHNAIMARSMGVPAVVGLGNITEEVQNGDILMGSGDEGIININPEESVLSKYQEENNKALVENSLLAWIKSKSQLKGSFFFLLLY